MRHLNLRNIFWLALLGALIATVSQTTFAQIIDSSTAAQAPAAGPAAAPGQAPAAAQAQAPVEPPQICGNQQLCQETADFAATITSLRVSTDSYNHKIMDTTIRFQNKTNQALVLGYVNQSGIATDDRGNRSVPWGPNAYRGIGLVAGSNFDPKFTVRTGGWGDAQFELVQQGWPQVVGFNYVLDLTVAEINTFEGNQHTLGGEFPLHFQGLANGSGAASPMFAPGSATASGAAAAFGSTAGMGSATSAMSNPCAAAGALGQGAGQATSTVATAANAISSLGSMFHHKKSQDAGQAAANAVGCAPNGAAPAAAVMPIPAAPLGQAVPTPVTTKAAQVTALKPITNAATSVTPATATMTPLQGAVVNAATRSAVTAPPAASAHGATAATQKPNPVPAAKPAPATVAAKPAPAKANARAQAVKQNTAVDQK
jgi:hypothetical protein